MTSQANLPTNRKLCCLSCSLVFLITVMWRPEVDIRYLSFSAFFFLLKQGLLLSLKLMNWLDWVTSKLQASACVHCSIVLRLHVLAGRHRLLHQCWGFKLRSSCKHNKHISPQAISLVRVKHIKNSKSKSYLGCLEKHSEHLWFKWVEVFTHSDLFSKLGSLWKILAANPSSSEVGLDSECSNKWDKTKCAFPKELHIGQMCP